MKTVIFDFGGVLVDWNPRYFYRTIFATEEEMEWFLANVCTNDWNLRHDAGVSFKENAQQLIKQYPQYSRQIEQYYLGWPQMLRGEIPGTHAIVNELKAAGVKMYGLTNWSAETFPVAFKRFEVLRQMDGIVVSGEEKCVKPGAEIFNRLLTRFDLKAEECVFVDDNAANIVAAQALGFDGILFQSAEQLQRQLTKRGLLR